MPASSAAVDDPLAGLHPAIAEVLRVCAGIEVRRLTSPRERETSLEPGGRDGGAHFDAIDGGGLAPTKRVG